MGLFSWIKKKNKLPDENPKRIQDYLNDMDGDGSKGLKAEKLEILPAYHAGSLEECQAFVENSCNQIREAGKRLKENKEEYASVGNALNDVQIVDNITGDDRLDLKEAAEKIMELNKERSQFQSSPSKISEAQYQKMEEYGEEIRRMMKRLDDDEKYSQALQNDMERIEGEKAATRYESDQIEDKIVICQRVIRWAVGIMIICLLFYITAIVLLKEQYDLFLYSMLAIVGVVLSFAFILFQKELKKLRYQERKMNKIVGLLNSTKLRFVNISHSITYQYQKYGVNSAYELNHLWGLYLEEKKQRATYQHNSQELHEAEVEMLGILNEYMLMAPRVWVNYASAIVDPKEMVEVRHDLNVRRQKLRAVMEYNQKVMARTEEELQKFVKLNQEYGEEILRMVKA